MYKNHITTMLPWLALSLLSISAMGSHFWPRSTAELITAIIIANHNGEDDVIDLDGRTFLVNKVYPPSDPINGNTCLPEILPDNPTRTNHSLTVMNGKLERDILGP